MSISESLSGDFPKYLPPPPAPAVTPPDLVEQLSDVLEDLMIVQSAERMPAAGVDLLGRGQPLNTAIVFRGKLLADAETLYPKINELFKKFGYTAMLQRDRDLDVVVAFDGVIMARQ